MSFSSGPDSEITWNLHNRLTMAAILSFPAQATPRLFQNRAGDCEDLSLSELPIARPPSNAQATPLSAQICLTAQ
jgi:hypothetical protein